MKKFSVFLTVLGILGLYEICYGWATEKVGPDSANRHPTVAQPDWSKGIVEVLRHQSRMYSIWVNGNENFYFMADPSQINELLVLFSKARMRDHEVVIKSAKDKRKVKTFKKDPVDYNVNLQIIGGIALAVYRRGDKVDTFEPKLTIYAGDDDVLLKHLKLPENVIVNCDIKDCNIKSKITKPKRKLWHGQVQFEDSSPAADFEHGLSTKITLWEKGFEKGILIGKVSHKGFFKAAFSENEIAGLKKGKSRLTITVGNYLTAAKKTDAIFPVKMLALEKDKAKAIKIGRPKFYYGRVLFEDGTPAFLDNDPWPGAEIMLSFPYAGSVKPDSQGYFKVYFTKEQYEKVKVKKSGKNIYIPNPSEKGSSTARVAYPVSLLSQDKTKAGVVKIPRPKLPKRQLATAESKIGKAIPGFDNIRFEVFQKNQTKDKPLLVCFWDIDQRPSRQYIRILEKQKDVLQDKNIVVLAVHSGTKQEKEVKKWLKKNGPSLTVGMIEGDPYNTLLAWGAKGLPWLILTDEQHIITNAGFSLDDLSLVN